MPQFILNTGVQKSFQSSNYQQDDFDWQLQREGVGMEVGVGFLARPPKNDYFYMVNQLGWQRSLTQFSDTMSAEYHPEVEYAGQDIDYSLSYSGQGVLKPIPFSQVTGSVLLGVAMGPLALEVGPQLSVGLLAPDFSDSFYKGLDVSYDQSIVELTRNHEDTLNQAQMDTLIRTADSNYGRVKETLGNPRTIPTLGSNIRVAAALTPNESRVSLVGGVNIPLDGNMERIGWDAGLRLTLGRSHSSSVSADQEVNSQQSQSQSQSNAALPLTEAGNHTVPVEIAE